jgi:hypothetical protein
VTYAYQWKRGGVNISGATANTYTLVTADLGAMITATVTATNTAGSASATATAVGPVTAAASTALSLQAQPGSFALSGESMEIVVAYGMQAGAGSFALAGQSATLTPPALAGPTVSYIGHVTPTGTGSSTLTATAVPIGNPSYILTRRVLVVLNGGSGSGCFITGGTIGGVELDQYTGYGNIASGNDGVDVFSAVVSSGTTATIVLNFNATVFGGPHFMVYNADNALMSAVDNVGNNPKVGQSENGSGTGLNTTTVNTTTKAGGFILAGAWVGGGAGPSITASTETYVTDYSSSANMTCHANNITSNAANSLSTQGPPAGGVSFLAMAAFK